MKFFIASVLLVLQSLNFCLASEQTSILVVYKDHATTQSIANSVSSKFEIQSKTDFANTKHIFPKKIQKWTVNKHEQSKILAQLNSDPNIEFAEPNYQVSIHSITNDPDFSELWGLHNIGQYNGTEDADIDAPEAWQYTTGSREVVIAVIDTGIDYNHPDLIENMWVNPNEIANNGIDDDNNGYVDDIYGINTIVDSGDPMDDNGHGTHIAGTIGATGNNGIGVVGVNHKVSMIGCKFIRAHGSGGIEDAIKCLDYLIDLKQSGVNIRISNNSWGGGSPSILMQSALQQAAQHDILFVAAAGNDGQDNDIQPHFPSSYEDDIVLSVASTTDKDNRSSFSNWGLTSVDLGAPGSSIYSTLPGGGYGYMSGTSMATPQVAGAAALLLAENPTLSSLEIKQILMDKGDAITPMQGKTISGKRLNIGQAIEHVAIPSFYIEGDDKSTIKQGETALYNFTVTNTQDWQGNIQLQTQSDLEVSLSQETVDQSSNFSLQVVTQPDTQAGSYTILLTAKSGDIVKNYPLSLTITDKNLVTFTFENNNAIEIPDNDSEGVFSVIDIAEAIDMTKFTISVNITHTYIGDLKVNLIDPQGNTFELHQQTGDSQDDLVKSWTFDPSLGNAQGQWKLFISDNASRDVGTLNNWSLEVKGKNTTPPIAEVDFSVEYFGSKVKFTDLTENTSITQWQWDFGDGNTANTQHPTHTYSNSGNYDVTLTVTDSNGNNTSHTKPITVVDNGFNLVLKSIEKQGSDYKIYLKWHGSDAIWLKLYRDGNYIKRVFNFGDTSTTLSDPIKTNYTYKLCDSSKCSNELIVNLD